MTLLALMQQIQTRQSAMSNEKKTMKKKTMMMIFAEWPSLCLDFEKKASENPASESFFCSVSLFFESSSSED